MLHWIEAEAIARGVEALVLTPAVLRTEADLVARLSGAPKWIHRLGGLSWKSVQWKPRERPAHAADEVLERRLRKAPLVLLIDEAHALDAEVGRSVLSAVQRLGASGAPLLLVLAGTPALPNHLGQMEATFWERSKILPLDRLPERDASDAIRLPFESAGRPISRHALEQAVSDSHGYPYFLQIWGEALWGRQTTPATTLAPSDPSRARESFLAERNQFYSLRYRELSNAGLVPAAAALAEAYGDMEELGHDQINAVLQATLARDELPCTPARPLRIRSADWRNWGMSGIPDTDPVVGM